MSRLQNLHRNLPNHSLQNLYHNLPNHSLQNLYHALQCHRLRLILYLNLQLCHSLLQDLYLWYSQPRNIYRIRNHATYSGVATANHATYSGPATAHDHGTTAAAHDGTPATANDGIAAADDGTADDGTAAHDGPGKSDDAPSTGCRSSSPHSESSCCTTGWTTCSSICGG